MNTTNSHRLVSLDVFRGITIVLMILVNSPGNHDAYAWLRHSTWNGCTLADLVFPFFINIVGISSVLALSNLKLKGFTNRSLFNLVMRRTIYLFSLGLLLNLLPNHFDLSQVRILGVLQRIAICYWCSSMLFLTTTIRTQIIIIIGLLMGYWIVMQGFADTSALSIDYNLVGYVDQWFFSSQHLYSPTFDPEGLLSTLPAIGSVLLGNMIGEMLIVSHIRSQQLRSMLVLGGVLSLLGLFWSTIFPFNKLLWSSSYVVWTSGLCILVFSICFALIEMYRIERWSKPFLLLGKNAMLIYILHVVFLKLQAMIFVYNAHGNMMDLRLYITDTLFSHFSTKTASLCYAIGYTAFWLFVLKGITQWRLLFKISIRKCSRGV